MSVQTLRYTCPNCGNYAREGSTLWPRECFLCSKIICSKCSPKGFCETCTPALTEEGSKKLNRVNNSRRILVGFIWFTLILGIVSIVMTIVAGTTNFQDNNPNATTIQSVFMGIAGVVFVLLIIIAPISVVLVRRFQTTQIEVANLARLNAQQTGIPIPNVGVLVDYELLAFRALTEKHLGQAPRHGKIEIVRELIQIGMLPDNPSFVEQVRGRVATKFRKVKDPGQAIMAFLVIVSIMELLSLAEGRPYSTLNSLPENVRGFLISVMNIQNAPSAAKKIIYGR